MLRKMLTLTEEHKIFYSLHMSTLSSLMVDFDLLYYNYENDHKPNFLFGDTYHIYHTCKAINTLLCTMS